jgi:hypothetical protein
LNDEDVKGLDEGAWLNSSVICTILLLAKGSGFSVAVVDPLTEDYQRLRERENIANSSIILLPLHSKDHWILAVIGKPRAFIHLYDSLAADRHLGDVKQRLTKFHKQVIGEGFNIQFNIGEQLSQENGYDCGVLVVLTGLCVAIDYPVPTSIDGSCCRHFFRHLVGPLPAAGDSATSDIAKAEVCTISGGKQLFSEHLTAVCDDSREILERLDRRKQTAELSINIVVKFKA